ncbi:type VI secretion system protein TssL [bacterium]|nr:type VI secretion system protein TssL [bacterium]
MSNNDPFAEPDDNERTVIRPNPGGKRTAPAMPQANYGGSGGQGYGTAAPAAEPSAAMGVPSSAPPRTAEANAIAITGVNQLVAIATPLFSLVSRIRNRAQHMDPEKLRQSVMAEVRAFENAALKAGEDAQKVKVARYALCATLDDVVLNTPWGEQSSWAMQSMVGTFHRETVGGDRFYDLLARLEQDPGTNIDLLEFLYMCLSLGFEGRLRVENGGQDRHLQIRTALARIIRGQRGEFERDLSPRWKGVLRPYKSLSVWKPVWIAVGATAALLALIFGGFSYFLSQRSGAVLAEIASIDTGVAPTLLRRAPPPPPPPPQKVDVDKVAQLSSFLAPEIKAGTVAVLTQGNTVDVRLQGAAMFASGSDQLSKEYLGIVNRVGEALKTEKGHIVVAGYSDSSPVGRGRFKDNTELSQARADAVLKMILPLVGDPSRIIAEGHGEKDPIADNKTKEGRAANRRIEILVVKGGEGS